MTPERIIRILKFCGNFLCAWPPEDNHTKRQRIVNDSKLFFMIANTVCLIIPLITGIYHNRHHTSTAMKASSELTAIGDVMFNLLMCRIHQNRLRVS